MNLAQDLPLSCISTGLNFPTSIALDALDNIYIAESGLAFDGAKAGGRVLRLNDDGSYRVLTDTLRQPVNGLSWDGELGFYVAEGGAPGRISHIRADNGLRTTVLDHLPSLGNYHTNEVACGPDGKLYFAQGAMTNMAVVGTDALDLAWLKRLPHSHDLPGFDIEIKPQHFCTDDARIADSPVYTSAFAAFGQHYPTQHRFPAQLPCTAAVMRCNRDGSELELVAWGVRNAYGLRFLPDGRLLATEQGADIRGSRPIAEAADLLLEIRPGAWYGWPDFVNTVPVTEARFQAQGHPPLAFVLANHQQLPTPEAALLQFPVNTSAVKFDCLGDDHPHWPRHIIVALFGDERPMTGPPGTKVGRNLVRVDPSDWSLHEFLPQVLHRPIDVRLANDKKSLYILDFGEFEMDDDLEVSAQAGSGSLWRLQL